jgi:oligopeptide transport system ATP-binding protein
MTALLEVKQISKSFPKSQGLFRPSRDSFFAVEDVSFELNQGETLAIVGESGCGKSTLARVLLRLIRESTGSILFEGNDLTKISAKELRQFRKEMQIVFQDPYASLNPRMTVSDTLSEPFEIHNLPIPSLGALLQQVGLDGDALLRYPHEFSGGQRQRIGIARAIALKPKLLICDEPVSALDVSIRAQVLNLLSDLKDMLHLSYIFIAHDLSVVADIADRVAVMYLGRFVEVGPTAEVFSHPHHPYTKALLSAVPIPDPTRERQRERIVLHGDVPNPANPPSGCPFRTRCWKAQEKCAQIMPPLEIMGTNHLTACYFPE